MQSGNDVSPSFQTDFASFFLQSCTCGIIFILLGHCLRHLRTLRNTLEYKILYIWEKHFFVERAIFFGTTFTRYTMKFPPTVCYHASYRVVRFGNVFCCKTQKANHLKVYTNQFPYRRMDFIILCTWDAFKHECSFRKYLKPAVYCAHSRGNVSNVFILKRWIVRYIRL